MSESEASLCNHKFKEKESPVLFLPKKIFALSLSRVYAAYLFRALLSILVYDTDVTNYLRNMLFDKKEDDCSGITISR